MCIVMNHLELMGHSRLGWSGQLKHSKSNEAFHFPWSGRQNGLDRIHFVVDQSEVLVFSSTQEKQNNPL